MADRGEDTPQHIVHFRQRLAEIFPGVRCPLRYYALHIFAAVVQRLSHGWNDMFRRILENGGNSKGVSNGFVISAVLVKEVKEALNRRFT